jgi:hypothetical protein
LRLSIFRKSKIPLYQERIISKEIRWASGMFGNMSCSAMDMRATAEKDAGTAY